MSSITPATAEETYELIQQFVNQMETVWEPSSLRGALRDCDVFVSVGRRNLRILYSVTGGRGGDWVSSALDLMEIDEELSEGYRQYRENREYEIDQLPWGELNVLSYDDWLRRQD